YVAGWIDWNHNGTFDDGERSGAVECDNGSVDLTWTVPMNAVDADTYLRLRITEQEADLASPTGITTSGEVEDYALTVDVPQLTITKTSDATADTRPGDIVNYTITASN